VIVPYNTAIPYIHVGQSNFYHDRYLGGASAARMNKLTK